MTIINPQIVIDNGWVRGIRDPETQVQPNGIDYTADKAFRVSSRNPFYVGEDDKVMRGSVEEKTGAFWIGKKQLTNTWRIQNGGMLDILSDMYVELPNTVAAILLPRSTLARNGLFTANGLYDSGFTGHIGTIIHNRGGLSYLQKGARVGQIIFIRSDKTSLYDGSYQQSEGEDLEYQDGND